MHKGSERRQREQAASAGSTAAHGPAAPRDSHTSPAAGLGLRVWKPVPERSLLWMIS